MHARADGIKSRYHKTHTCDPTLCDDGIRLWRYLPPAKKRRTSHDLKRRTSSCGRGLTYTYHPTPHRYVHNTNVCISPKRLPWNWHCQKFLSKDCRYARLWLPSACFHHKPGCVLYSGLAAIRPPVVAHIIWCCGWMEGGLFSWMHLHHFLRFAARRCKGKSQKGHYGQPDLVK